MSLANLPRERLACATTFLGLGNRKCSWLWMRARVEDNLEIKAAKTQASKTRPLRITPAIPVSGEPVTFSHDGRFLACGNTVWKVGDWSKAGGFDQEGSIERVLFSKDDKFLYVVGGGGGMEIHNRFDWRTGKLDKAFEGHHQGVFLSL